MKYMDGVLFKKCLKGAYEKLEKHKDEVDRLNVFPVPDGDTGTNMSLTMKSAIEQIEQSKDDSLAQIGKALGFGTLMGARGNSGVILSQLCRGMADALKGKTALGIQEACEIFSSAREKAYKAVMKPTEGTILSVARSLDEFSKEKDLQKLSLEEFLKQAVLAANVMLQKTPDMLEELKEAGVVDAGGQGLVYLLTGFTETLVGEDLSDLSRLSKAGSTTTTLISPGEEKLSLYQSYKYFVKVKMVNTDPAWLNEKAGDFGPVKSIRRAKGAYYLEAYANEPQKLLGSLMKNGEVLEMNFIQAKATKMAHLAEDLEKIASEKPREPRKKAGFVAVCLGEGFKKIFEQLMVDQIVTGGQTMNPSTRDLYEAASKVNAETVYILPNNKNIIMAAEQVGSLSDSRIVVIPSKSMPQGITALFNYNESASPEENEEAMTESLSQVISGQVTYAIRSTEVGGLKIQKDDRIGLINGEIRTAGKNDEEIVMELLKTWVRPDDALITLYAGQDVSEARFRGLTDQVSREFRDKDVESEVGGQPIYSYIFSIEK